jgi:hypothetical protein
MGLALDLGVGPPTLEGASASVLATSSGALAGLGLTLLSGRDQQLASAALSASTLVGFGAGALSAYVLNPTVEDIAFGTAVGAMTTAATTLAAFAAVPVGNARVYGDVSRIDFSLGLGLGVGGIAGLSALLLGPIVEVPPARMLAAGAGGAVGAVVGLAAGFLPVPTDVDVRVRVGAGAGLAGLLVGATLGALFVPDAWVAAPLGRPEPSPSALLVVERGHVRLGAPAIMTSATSVGLAVVGGAL